LENVTDRGGNLNETRQRSNGSVGASGGLDYSPDRSGVRKPKWWADVLSGRVRKDWDAMEEFEALEGWARR
jgi:hypothetical protein